MELRISIVVHKRWWFWIAFSVARSAYLMGCGDPERMASWLAENALWVEVK